MTRDTFNELIFFVADDGTHGKELWQTDGTADGTILYDISPYGGSDPTGLIAVAGTLYFSAERATLLPPGPGRELWKLKP